MKRSFLFLSIVLLHGEANAAVCASTTVSLASFPLPGYSVEFPATVDSALVEFPPSPGIYAGFNFHEGRLFGSNSGHCGSFVMEGSETYRIEASSSHLSSWHIEEAVSLPLTITLSADIVVDEHHIGDVFCKSCPSYELSLQASSGERDSLYLRGLTGAPTHRTIHIDLSPLVGEEFTVRYRVYGTSFVYCGVPATVKAQIGFTGVPPGATLVSACRDDEPAVPTKKLTWGSLKATYR